MMVTITCSSHPKGHKVKAVCVRKGLAVTPALVCRGDRPAFSRKLFAVTHIKSGYAAGTEWTKPQAIQVLKGLLPLVDWTVGKAAILRSTKRHTAELATIIGTIRGY